MKARPFCLRVSLDVDLAESEWAILSQAMLKSSGTARELELHIRETTPASRGWTTLAELPARPAGLELSPEVALRAGGGDTAALSDAELEGLYGRVLLQMVQRGLIQGEPQLRPPFKLRPGHPLEGS